MNLLWHNIACTFCKHVIFFGLQSSKSSKGDLHKVIEVYGVFGEKKTCMRLNRKMHNIGIHNRTMGGHTGSCPIGEGGVDSLILGLYFSFFFMSLSMNY